MTGELPSATATIAPVGTAGLGLGLGEGRARSIGCRHGWIGTGNRQVSRQPADSWRRTEWPGSDSALRRKAERVDEVGATAAGVSGRLPVHLGRHSPDLNACCKENIKWRINEGSDDPEGGWKRVQVFTSLGQAQIS